MKQKISVLNQVEEQVLEKPIKRKRVGILGGGFNPVHVGHLSIANYMADYAQLDEIWFVVSPQNPFKEQDELLDENIRIHLLNLAVAQDKRFKTCDIEFKLSKPSYTYATLDELKKEYPHFQFTLIIGGDNLQSFHKWKNYEVILQNHDIFVYPRLNSGEIDEHFVNHSKIHRVRAPVIELSSTFIRESIKSKKNIR